MIVKESRGEILDQLNKLLTSSRDAEKGYQEAADNVKGTELKNLFLAQSCQRGEYTAELDREIRALGGDAGSGTSLGSDLHRAWISVKSTLSGNSDKAVAEECRRSDSEALANYSEVLEQTDVAASTRELLLNQKSKVKLAHSIMGRLALVV